MITWAQVVAFAPELTNVNPTVQALLLARAQEVVPAAEFCGEASPSYNIAMIYMVAHMASLHVQTCGDAMSAGATGPVQSESVGGLSISYKDGYGMGGAPASREGFERTRYGAAYLELLRSSPCGSGGLGIMVL